MPQLYTAAIPTVVAMELLLSNDISIASRVTDSLGGYADYDGILVRRTGYYRVRPDGRPVR